MKERKNPPKRDKTETQISLSLSKLDLEEIDKLAQAARESRSAFIRKVSLGKLITGALSDGTNLTITGHAEVVNSIMLLVSDLLTKKAVDRVTTLEYEPSKEILGMTFCLKAVCPSMEGFNLIQASLQAFGVTLTGIQWSPSSKSKIIDITKDGEKLVEQSM